MAQGRNSNTITDYRASISVYYSSLIYQLTLVIDRYLVAFFGKFKQFCISVLKFLNNKTGIVALNFGHGLHVVAR